MPPSSLIGRRFGRLTVQSYSHSSKSGSPLWNCVCDCGCLAICSSPNLYSGNTKSCGCIKREITSSRSRTHGATGTPEYRVWYHIIGRCTSKGDPAYHNYGGRGIAVCDEWKNSFESFFSCVGKRPSSLHTLDRIDNNGNYEPGNVRWATRKEQANNLRRNTIVEFRGSKMTLSEFSDAVGVPYRIVYGRFRSGWSIEECARKSLGVRRGAGAT